MKLKLNTGKASSSDADTSQSAHAEPTPPTPASAASAGGFRLSLKASQPPTPATEQPSSAANGTKSKQQPKPRKTGGGGGGGNKKRPANDDISPAAKRLQNGAAPGRKISLKIAPQASASGRDDAPQSAGGLNKLSLKRRSTAPKLRALTAARKPPPRLPGQGYDSEDSEAEDDPAIQQAFILRMQPGEDCEYVREAIANGKFGLPPSEGPAEVSMRFIDKDFRRAIITVRGRMYAAVLVDLPCIVETMKSWDKKGWWKVADLCQMLLVLGRCSNEDEAKTYALPREVDKETLQYAHGLTPPMHWVRKRRFRKRLTYKAIANVDEEVERLLQEDEAAERQGGKVDHEYLNRAELERSQETGESGYDDEEDVEGEAIETVENGQAYEEYYSDEGDADLERNLQDMFDEDADAEDLPVPDANDFVTDSPAPALPDQAASYAAIENTLLGTESAAATPAATQDQTEGEETTDHYQSPSEDSGSEEEDEEEEADSPDVMDEDAAAKAAERNQQLEEVADLEREIENQKRKVEAITNQLLKQRAIAQLRTLEEDLRVKRQVFGLDDGDEDDEIEE
ncbi:hypothetical protein LTR37_000914 [Vermiconidia calcicola]|uniref:Uncharacterized protein n=1 Tax=Vermiconidia calcicola TaxID=1690605 RepID=A0ACC3NXS1_9PEZI|nr:hypothetical protein LTR37_000914 [Vermiconidia calcicola]